MEPSSNSIENTNYNDSKLIEGRGYSSFLFTLAKSTFIGMAIGFMFEKSGVDTYIAAIIGTIIGLIPLLIFLFITKNSKGKDIIDLNVYLFGKPIGTILNTVLNLTVFFMCIIVFYNITQFINTEYMPDTNINYCRFIIILVVTYTATKNIATISRVSQILLIINIIFFILSFFGLMNAFDTSEILPILSDGIKPTLCSSIMYAIFTTFPIFLLTIIKSSEVKEEKGKTKSVILMYLFVNIIIITLIVITTLVLGGDVVKLYKYPEYTALKAFSLLNILERIENILALQFIFNVFVFLTLSLYFVTTSIKKLFKDNKKVNKIVPYILGVIIMIVVNIFFNNSFVADNFIKKYVLYIIGIGIIGIMFITFLGVLLKKISNKTKSKKNNQNYNGNNFKYKINKIG